MKAIGYCRVSTREQATEGISLQNQREKIKSYCDLNNLELVKIIQDAGISGKDLNREGLQELLSLIKRNEIQAIIVYKLDRLSRKVIDTLHLIEQFENHSLAFHSIQEKLDTDTAMGKFFLNITASFAQMERDIISERTSDALQSKKERNELVGSIPFGFELADNSIDLIENPEEQKAISLIKNLRDKGSSLRKICRELESKGFSPRGKQWHPTTVNRIIANAA